MVDARAVRDNVPEEAFERFAAARLLGCRLGEKPLENLGIGPPNRRIRPVAEPVREQIDGPVSQLAHL